MLCIPPLHSALLKSDLHLPRGFSACVQRGYMNVQSNCKKVQMMNKQDVVYDHFVFIMSIVARYKSSVSVDKYKLIIYFHLAVFPHFRDSTYCISHLSNRVLLGFGNSLSAVNLGGGILCGFFFKITFI